METRDKNTFESHSYLYWKSQIAAAKAWLKPWHDTGDKIVARYRDEDRYEHDRRYNILYSNTETLLPVIYSSAPKAEVIAQDPSEIANRKSAEMIEDAINYYLEGCEFNSKARMAAMDFLLPGMGLLRPRYDSLIGEEEIEIDDIFEKQERVLFEKIDCDYVHWKDFIYPECASWDDLPWVAFKTLLSYEEAVEQFGEDKAKLLNYTPFTTKDQFMTKEQEGADNDKAEILEIWDKSFREQLFFAETAAGALLEINDDPLDLEQFFPVPKPMFFITTSETMIPRPAFKMYEDQAIELNKINERIYAMIDNMKRRGFYDASIDELGNIESMGDNTFWPVKNWDSFSGKGGLAGVMQTEEITSYANILQILEQSRRQLLEDIYQIIGISDIRRAQTDPRETLGAQQLKSRYGTIRISTYQRKVSEFMRDFMALMGEIIIKQFDPETIALITNRPLKTEMGQDEQGQPLVKQVGVVDLLKDLREKAPINIRIDIQSDSTILEDIEGERAAMAEAISALTEFTSVAPGLMQSLGQKATSNVLMGIIAKFKLGRDIQQDVEDHILKLETEGLPQEPSPEEVIAQAELQKTQMQMAMEQQKMQMNAVIESGKLQIKQQENLLKAEELGMRKEIEREKLNLDALDKMIKMQGLEVEAMNPNDNAVAESD